MTGLFRQQAMERQADRLHGEVLLLPRLSHTLVLVFLLLWVVAALCWLTTGSYARKETVQGWLEPSSGVVRVYAERSGIIKQVLATEGERVAKDQPLIIVNGDRILADGKHLESLLLAEYESQRKLLTEQLARNDKIHARQQRNIEQRIAATEEDLGLLKAQIQTLDRRYRLVDERVQRYRRLAQKGHISSAELDAVVAQELELRGERQALSRSRVNLHNQLQQLENERALLPEERANEGTNCTHASPTWPNRSPNCTASAPMW